MVLCKGKNPGTESFDLKIGTTGSMGRTGGGGGGTPSWGGGSGHLPPPIHHPGGFADSCAGLWRERLIKQGWTSSPRDRVSSGLPTSHTNNKICNNNAHLQGYIESTSGDTPERLMFFLQKNIFQRNRFFLLLFTICWSSFPLVVCKTFELEKKSFLFNIKFRTNWAVSFSKFPKKKKNMQDYAG